MERPNGLAAQATAGARQRARVVSPLEPVLCPQNRERTSGGSRGAARKKVDNVCPFQQSVANGAQLLAEPTGLAALDVAAARLLADVTPQQRCFWGASHAKAAQLAVGAARLRCGRVGRCARPGAARGPQCRSRLPSGSHLQFRPLRLLSRVPVGLHLPGVPLRSCPLCRRRCATRLPAHALHLGRLRPIAHGTFPARRTVVIVATALPQLFDPP